MARKPHKFSFIYKTTNLLNNKFYIGMHSTNDLKDEYLGSGIQLRRSIRKYGKENFKKEILEFLPDRSSLKEREKQLINEDILKDLMCMNLRLGGEGGFISVEQQAHRSKCGGLAYGKKLKEDSELRRQMFNLHSKTFKRLWKEKKLKTNYYWLNKHHNEETKQKISCKAKLRTNDKNSMFNQHHNEETKQLISEKLKSKIKELGFNASQYGRCWITNGIKNKMIKKENLVLEKTWYLGRTLR